MSLAKNATLDEMYTELVAGVEAFNATQDNPLNVPEGFHYVLSARGEDAGFGFYCPKCKLHVSAFAPGRVSHCGTLSFPPEGYFAKRRMQTYQLRGF